MPVPSLSRNREAEVLRFKPIEVPKGNLDLFDTHLMRAFMFKWGMSPTPAISDRFAENLKIFG